MPIEKKDSPGEVSRNADTSTVRASISFPRDVYEQLERLAIEKQVSLAWVVREAVRAHLKSQRSASKAGNR